MQCLGLLWGCYVATKKMINNNTINKSIDVHILTLRRFSVTHWKNSQVSDIFLIQRLFSSCRKDSLDGKVSKKHSDEAKRERLAS